MDMRLLNSVLTALTEMAPTLKLLDKSEPLRETDLALPHRDNLKRLDKLGLVCKREGGNYWLKRQQLKRLLERESRGLASSMTLQDLINA